MFMDIIKYKNTKLETKRLYLVPFSLKYKYFLLKNNNDKRLNKYTSIIGKSNKNNISEVEKYIKKTKKDKRMLFFIVLLKENNQPIGSLGLNQLDFLNKGATTFSWLSFNYWKKGYMYEAKKELINFAFKKLKLNRIESTCFKENKNIINHLKSLGFRKEGVLKKSLFYKNKYRDELIFGLLKSEFKYR